MSRGTKRHQGMITIGGLCVILVSMGCLGGRRPAPRIYAMEEVDAPPKLLGCATYRLPKQHEIYENAVNVEFEVTAAGMVASEHVIEKGHLLSSKGSYREALEKVRSCRFQPAEYWGRPVSVQMRMWVMW